MEDLNVEIKNEQDFLKTIADLHSAAIMAKYLIISLCRFRPEDMSYVDKEAFSAYEHNVSEKIKELENLSGIIFNYLRENGNYRKN